MASWSRFVALAGIIAASVSCSDKVAVRVPTGPRDADQDGVADGADKCPKEHEDGLPPDPHDGCPGTDVDGDGLAGAADRCPEQPESRNGVEDADGCPESEVTVTQHARVQITKNELKITEKILFEFAKANIDEKSNGLVDEIAKVMKDNPQV